MNTMKPTTLVLIAIVLAVATAATAATAFAGAKKKHVVNIEEQVADSVQGTSQAMLRLKSGHVRRNNDTANPAIYLPRPKN